MLLITAISWGVFHETYLTCLNKPVLVTKAVNIKPSSYSMGLRSGNKLKQSSDNYIPDKSMCPFLS